MLLLDLVPLQDPSEDWSANKVYWVRHSITSAASSFTILLVARHLVSGMNLTTARNGVIAATSGVAHTGVVMAITHYWAFPVPFASIIGSVPFTASLNLFAVAPLECADRELLGRYFKFANFFGLQASMVMVYPTYNAAFLSLEGVSQLAFVLLLPVIKIGFKYLISVTQSEDDDIISALHSSVDIFDALYMTKCMQSAGTLAVAFGIIIADLAQNYIAIRVLAKQTQSLQHATAHKASGDSQSSTNLLPLAFK